MNKTEVEGKEMLAKMCGRAKCLYPLRHVTVGEEAVDRIEQPIKSAMKQLKTDSTAYQNKIIHHMKENETLVNHQGDEIATFRTDSRGVRKLLTR